MKKKYRIYFVKAKKCKSNDNLYKKTNIWLIRKDSEYALAEHLGIIQWNGSWRKYCFFPDIGTLWDFSCLIEISAFLIRVNREHKQNDILPYPKG
jgi:hypothetical protein